MQKKADPWHGDRERTVFRENVFGCDTALQSSNFI